MDCGYAGHILLSKHVAEDLEGYEQWRPLLHDLGVCEVKHGLRVSLVNLYGDHVGNATLPKKFQTQKKRSARIRWAAISAVLLALAAIVAEPTFSPDGQSVGQIDRSAAIREPEPRSGATPTSPTASRTRS